MVENSEKPDERRGKVLAALEAGKPLVAAAADAGVSNTTLWRWRRDDADFAEQVDRAREVAWDERASQLSQILFEGAGKAAEDPRYTTQLIFALKNLAPDQFRDAHDLRHSGALTHEHNVVEAQVQEHLARLAAGLVAHRAVDAGDAEPGGVGEAVELADSDSPGEGAKGL